MGKQYGLRVLTRFSRKKNFKECSQITESHRKNIKKLAPAPAPAPAEPRAVHLFRRKGAPPKAAVLLEIILNGIGKTT